MDPNQSESGFELDGRKIIIAFVVIILLCGSFFVIGFREGKRQGLQAAAEQRDSLTSEASGTSVPGRESSASVQEVKPPTPEDPSVRDQLDWYRNVREPESRGKEQTLTPPPPRTEQKKESPPVKTVVEPPGQDSATPSRSAAKVTYSVQVGAFSQRREAEVKAGMLKASGYSYTIEPPGPSNKYYLLKVGRFDTRADAVAMQLRLQKDGFSTFIKTN